MLVPFARIVAVMASVVVAGPARAADWPQWRGPEANGVSRETGLPVRWSPTENVAWSLPLPGPSGSTPIITGDRVFLNVAEGNDLALWCVGREKGDVMWKRALGSGNVTMRKHNMSSPSPVTDGKSVYVITGTGILKGFSLDGRELWSRDLPKEYGHFGLNWGYASSPLLEGDSLYVQVLHGMKTDQPSYLLRIETATGKNRWRVERKTAAISESPDAYTTPLAVRVAGGTEIVVTGADVITGHDPATGRELWRANGLNPTNDPYFRIVASSVAAKDVVFASSRVRPLLAVRAGGRGDVTTSHKLWSFDQGPDVPTPASDGQYLYVVNDKGIAWCLDAATGKPLYGPQRLKPATYSASPVLADGRIYMTSEDGVTSVYKAGPVFELLAENSIEDVALSSFAVSSGRLYLRTAHKLWAIGGGGKATAAR
jgi:outer membrane protein assembly factor BamB